MWRLFRRLASWYLQSSAASSIGEDANTSFVEEFIDQSRRGSDPSVGRISPLLSLSLSLSLSRLKVSSHEIERYERRHQYSNLKLNQVWLLVTSA